MPLTNDDLTKIANLVNSAKDDVKDYVDKKFDEDLYTHPVLVKIQDMLDKILGNQIKDKQDLDLVNSRVGNHEERLEALESNSQN